MQIVVTAKGDTIRISMSELRKIKQVQRIIEHLSAHRPLIEDYRLAADALKRALEMFGDSRDSR